MNFDVPMRGYDSSQIADLVGLYILHVLNRIINSDQVALYRGDGICISRIVIAQIAQVYKKKKRLRFPIQARDSSLYFNHSSVYINIYF